MMKRRPPKRYKSAVNKKEQTISEHGDVTEQRHQALFQIGVITERAEDR
jgi:hypothetical protein